MQNAIYVRAHQINNIPRAKCSLFAYLYLRTYLDASAQYRVFGDEIKHRPSSDVRHRPE
jgi:hypothetical protein